MTREGAALPPGLALINWGTCETFGALCSKVGFCFIISRSRCLAWLPCCNSSSFSRIPSHVSRFCSQRRQTFSASCFFRSVTVGEDAMEAYPAQHPHTHLSGLTFRNFAQDLSTNRAWSGRCCMWSLKMCRYILQENVREACFRNPHC